MTQSPLVQSPTWRALEAHAVSMKHRRLTWLFDEDAQRATKYSASAAGLYLDYSKQKLTQDTLALLFQLAERQHLSQWIDRMFGGDHINDTEDRAVGHVALRAPAGGSFIVDGRNVVEDVHDVLGHMQGFAQQLREGQWKGATGQAITDVVNIGIGGSDLGPRMVCETLAEFCSGPRTHFVANVDATQICSLLAGLDPARTLFIITSKTFTTQETMANADTARRWLVAALGADAVSRHFVAVSTNAEAVSAFGIETTHMFGFWDWVGGRYSAWSAVGLSVMIAIGPELFAQWLAGAHAMDEHFRTAPLTENLPVMMGLIGVWNHNFLESGSQVIAPYAQRLDRFVAWLQQLEMESNGKGVDRQGHKLAMLSTPAIWGDVGTNAQHAFFQMLHQSPSIHPVDFILPVAVSHPEQAMHRMLIANCLAQSAALMRGKTAEEVRAELSDRFHGHELEKAIPPRVFTGNRPSSTVLMPRLDPWHLGSLMALYEHRTYVMGVIWDINSFDQWGVELGKKLTKDILAAMSGEEKDLDGSTRQLMKQIGV